MAYSLAVGCLFFVLNSLVLTDIVIGEDVTNGIHNIFEEIGFSPYCVSKTLSQCENSQGVGVSLVKLSRKLEKLLKASDDRMNATANRPSNCWDLLESGYEESGIQVVYPYSCCQHRRVLVFCDQDTDGGGWTTFQRRDDVPQREDFYRTWVEYQLGFGNKEQEFWLGLENIHALVSSVLMEIRIDLEDYAGEKRWAKYDHFYISGIEDNYRLSLGSYSGTAGDSFTRHNGYSFSTKDKDNDIHKSVNCASSFKGAWWYKDCHDSNLNGYQYAGQHDSHADGINWKAFRGQKYSLKTTSMKLRPKFPNRPII